MKKLFFLIVLMFILSCEKDSRCWECTTLIVTKCGGYASDDASITSTQCDISSDDIRAYENAMSTTVTMTSNGITCTARSTCKCREK